MKILIISTTDPNKIAGRVALDLYNGLKQNNVGDIKIFVKEYKDYLNKDIMSFDTYLSQLKNRFFRKCKRGLKKIGFIKNKLIKTNPDYHVHDIDQTVSYYSTKKVLKKLQFKPDVIIVLFTQNFLSFKNLYEIEKELGSKIYILLMDMALYTGLCHYSWDCMGYIKSCGKCPALYSNNRYDQSHTNWKFKKEYIEKMNITPVAASEWQWKQINLSSLFANKNKVKILSPTDDRLYKPGDKMNSRKKLNINWNGKIIFFGAVNPLVKRKGYKELVESLEFLFKTLSNNQIEDILVLIAGHGSEHFRKDILFKVHFTGYLNHDELAIAYQASDIFLNASIEDAGPTMINQSIMSGIPVVAFEMGVAPDLVISGKTGYMAKFKDTKDYANGIKEILELNELEYSIMSNNCRELALKTCGLKQVAQEYIQLLNK